MKILIIYPNKVMVTRMPLGLCYLVSHLKKEGHDVKIFDTTFIKCSDIQGDDKLRESSLQVKNPDLDKFGLVGKDVDVFIEFKKMIEEFQPNLVGMSASDPNYSFGLKFLTVLKEHHPEIPTIVGGPTPTVCPEEVIQQDCVDMICVGEAEEALPELCKRLESDTSITDIKNIWVKKNGVIHKNSVRNLQDINKTLEPDLSALDERHLIRPLGGKVYRMATVMWTRGCLFHCNYCANSYFVNIYKNKGNFYRIKDPDIFVNELKNIKNKYKLNFLFFVDDIFPLHKKDILERFCSLYSKNIDLPFSINLHPTLITEEAIKKVVEIGCVNVCIGLESGNPEIRKNVLGRNYTDEQIINVFHLAKKYNIRSSSFNMIGLPNETREDIMKTIELNRKAGPNSATLTFFHPYRGSTLRDFCLKQNLFDVEKEEENVYRAESHLNLQISKDELRGLFKTFQLYFKLPKQYHAMIRASESESEKSKELMGQVLKPLFNAITKNEMVWDFLQRKESWKKLAEETIL